MWESTEYFGGTESCFESSESAQLQLRRATCIGSRLIKTPNNEILAAQNVGVRIFDRYRKFTESRLVSLSWNGFQMVENWRTAGLKGYLGDYALADADNDGKQQLVMAVKFKHKNGIWRFLSLCQKTIGPATPVSSTKCSTITT